MTAKAIMIQGTGSDVGKSIIVAGLCRAARRNNIRVAPFKPQNMSNNAAACPDGGEIGRAQALQALAAGVQPQVHHNPVLLKPQTDRVAQVVVQGHVQDVQDASHYIGNRDKLLTPVMQSFTQLANDNELIVVEGAGSPAETNLRDRDIANMGFAVHAGVPVCLLADIERGGVIASIVGTKAVISAQDARMICGFAVNKFRGDRSLFDDGVTTIEEKTGWPCFGVIPWLAETTRLPAEDAVSVLRDHSKRNASIKIVAPMLSRMANFDDADPLRLEPDVDFEFVPPGKPLPRDADLIVLFGTKSTIGDLEFLRRQGWDHDIIAHARSGGRVLGICGGYQMLGEYIDDPDGSDGDAGRVQGLGLLNLTTEMSPQKTVRQVDAVCAISGLATKGYEIHVGKTSGPDCQRPMLKVGTAVDGATSANGRVAGTYIHGLMSGDHYRAWFLDQLGAQSASTGYDESVNEALDQLANSISDALDVDRLFAAAREPTLGFHD